MLNSCFCFKHNPVHYVYCCRKYRHSAPLWLKFISLVHVLYTISRQENPSVLFEILICIIFTKWNSEQKEVTKNKKGKKNCNILHFNIHFLQNRQLILSHCTLCI